MIEREQGRKKEKRKGSKKEKETWKEANASPTPHQTHHQESSREKYQRLPHGWFSDTMTNCECQEGNVPD